ncbi:hypothetical protein [Propioniciclava tarda]|uniref:Uncharacterized protein n=1 Tax=Propioniciclava tarda TaxID=433330 RepID=A0A4Q9KJB2_PROTD|nr:hypothetical protein [Propioniciclava tarda]TBT94532.1 hypothetical protein ET996_10075 [Propioniciclava tarda]
MSSSGQPPVLGRLLDRLRGRRTPTAPESRGAAERRAVEDAYDDARRRAESEASMRRMPGQHMPGGF